MGAQGTGLTGLPNYFCEPLGRERYDKVLDAVKSSINLTVGEDSEFLQAGGMVSLQAAGNGVLFDVNPDAVSDGHLKLSSQMLSLARRVVHHPESARN